jgi:hypothetical protein
LEAPALKQGIEQRRASTPISPMDFTKSKYRIEFQMPRSTDQPDRRLSMVLYNARMLVKVFSFPVDFMASATYLPKVEKKYSI